MTTADAWSSGLFQFRSTDHGIDLTVGHATLTRDALGQPLARLTLASGGVWERRLGVGYSRVRPGNLVDRAAEVLFDSRADTGVISREGSFPLPSREHDDTLYAPADYPDDEVFAALVDMIRPIWQIEPVGERHSRSAPS